MPLHRIRAGVLFFIVFASAIVGLLIGSELVRWIMAGALVIVAGPLWISMQRESIAKGISRAADIIRGRHESS